MDESIQKGALGIRYIIKYLENNNVANYKIIKNCKEEIQLWLLITLLANNNDYLWESIPEYILEHVFKMIPFDNVKKANGVCDGSFGKGYHTNSNWPYKEQFRLIRNALAHYAFDFKNSMINVRISNFNASFDLKWLETAVMSAVANERYTLNKGMSDYSIVALVPNNENYTHEDFMNFVKLGLIGIYKVTCLTSSKEALARIFDLDDTDMVNFNLIFKEVMYQMQRMPRMFNASVSQIREEVLKKFRDIEAIFKNYVHLELLYLDASSSIFQERAFQALSFRDKLSYLINLFQYQNPVKYNTIMCHNLLDFIYDIEMGEESPRTLLITKDAYMFLIKAYGNILLAPGIPSCGKEILNQYSMECRFVHASNIYKSYIKALKRYYKELEEHNGKIEVKKEVLSLLDVYTKLLEEVQRGEVRKHIFWNMRNAIIHNHIEDLGDRIRFYITGQNLSLKHFSKKSKTWVDKDFVNEEPIWEMVISKSDFLALLDELYEANGIEVAVNISKYCKRSGVLKK